MTKKDLVNSIAASTGVTKADSEFMLDAITKAIADCLVSGDSIRLPALGSFKVGTVAAHDVDNHLVGGIVHFDEKKRVSFKPTREFRDRLNG